MIGPMESAEIIDGYKEGKDMIVCPDGSVVALIADPEGVGNLFIDYFEFEFDEIMQSASEQNEKWSKWAREKLFELAGQKRIECYAIVEGTRSLKLLSHSEIADFLGKVSSVNPLVVLLKRKFFDHD